MKKITLFLFVLSATLANAQLPVSQTAEKKKAIIEEWTGYKCPYCPGGHQTSDQIVTANPTNIFCVKMHEGNNIAAPSGSDYDFRTPDGTAILRMSEMKVVGAPAGAINRASCTNPQQAGGLLMSPNYWSAAVNKILSENAYVNIAGAATLNTSTRVLTINIEAYYTGNGSAANKLTVMLLQDNILFSQTNGSTYPAMMVNGQYKHTEVLRDVITAGSFGQPMGATTAGTLYTTTLTYTIPASYLNIPVVLSDLKLLAMVSESNINIINVCKVPITSTATGINELNNLVSSVNVFPNPVSKNANVSFNIHEENNVSVALSNMVGQIVLTENLGQLPAGAHNYFLNASNLQGGLYLLTITAGTSSTAKTVSIDR